MPPSGEELILKLLSQSVARLESGDRKRKHEEEEVIFLKSVKKVKKDSITTYQSDMLESLVVLQYLKEVSPTLAKEFSDSHIFHQVSCHLKNVFPGLAEELSTIYGVKKPVTEIKKLRNKKTGIVAKRFTPQEDEIIKAGIEDADEGFVNITLLSKKLNRTTRSIQSCIESLIRVNGDTKKTRFTLSEDILLLKRLVIPRVGSEKILDIILQKHQYADLTKQLRKSPIAVRHRWETCLQPWLLQHYSGTLNLGVERMLANYILDNYTDFSSIDWPEVAARSEFAGHTVSSLRYMYLQKLNKAKNMLRLQSDQLRPLHIAEYCELVYGVGATGRATTGASLYKGRRQSEVISFFKRRMKELKLNNFA